MFETLHIRKGLKYYMSEKTATTFGDYLMDLTGQNFSKIILHSQPRNFEETEWLGMTIATRLRPGGTVTHMEPLPSIGVKELKTHITKRPRRAKIRNTKSDGY
jgi:hypothetical protein